jgi:hypothetical protein
MILTSVLSTGLSSFANPSTIGPMYPGVGVEWLYVLFIFLAWVGWHVWQLRNETKELKAEAEHFRKVGYDKVKGGAADRRETME